MINYSEVESNRFKIAVYRMNADSINPEELEQKFQDHQIDLLVLRVPVIEISNVYLLEQLKIPYLVTDTLVYYDIDLKKIEAPVLRNTDLTFREAQLQDQNELQKLIYNSFEGYRNHYYSNPYLDKTDITDGYTEWALGHLNSPGKICFLALDNENEILGFAACSFSSDTAEGVIFGVSPKAAGRGIYTDLIKYSHQYFKKNNFNKMKVSTQIQNFTVQRVWTKEGYLIEKAFLTIHLNNMIINK